MEETHDASVPAGPLLGPSDAHTPLLAPALGLRSWRRPSMRRLPCRPRRGGAEGGAGASEAQTEHAQTPQLALGTRGLRRCGPSMRRLPCPSRARGLPRRRPSTRRLPCLSLVEHAQTLVLPGAASGLGVLRWSALRSSARRRPAPLPSFNDLLVLVCAQL